MRLRGLGLVLALLLLVGSTYCLAQRNIIEPSMTITISTARATVEMGDDILLKVVLKNVSDRVIALSIAPSPEVAEQHYTIRVRETSGKPVAETSYGAAARTGTIVGTELVTWLKPGEEFRESAILNKIHDLSQPGTYAIQVSRTVPDRPEEGNINSNELKITITRK